VIKKIILFFLLVFSKNLLSYSIEFEGDWLKYDYGKDEITSGDRVKINWQDKEIKGDSLFFDRKSSTVFVTGNVLFKDKTIELKADSIKLDQEGKGNLVNVRIHFDKYYLKAEKILRISDKEYILKRAYISTCDLDKPHYKIEAKNIFFYPENKLVARNAVLKFGRVPLFYFPYWWQSFKERAWGIRIDIGKSRNQGSFIRSEIYYRFTKNLKTSLLVDYFSKIGIGTGVEGDYNSDKFKSNVWFYNIKNNKKLKFYLWGDYKNFITQSNIEYYSSPNFNFDYFWEAPVLYPVRIKSRFGISRNTRIYNFLLYYYKEQESSNDVFKNIEVVRPGFDFYLLPRKFLFLNYSLKLNGYDRFYYTYNEYRKKIETSFSIYRNFNISRIFSFYPKFGYDFSYYNRDVSEYLKWNGSIGIKFLRYFRFNFYQKYKTEINGLVQYNYIGLTDIIKFSRNSSLKNSVELNILNGFKNYKNNFSPFTSRFDLRVKGYKIYFKNRYRIYPSKNLDSELFLKKGIFGINIFYNYSYKNKLDIINTFNFKIGRKWRFNIRIRYDAYYNDISFKNLWYKEISFIRDLHCWEMDFKYKERENKKEFWVFFKIKAFPRKPLGIYYNRKDGKWSLKKK